MSTIHVVIASIPERVANLRGLLTDLQTQTLQPSEVVLYQNGYLSPRHFPNATRIDWSATRRPAGIRWQYMESGFLTDDTIICVLDDDFRVSPTYLAETVTALTPSVGMVAWTGHRTLRTYQFLEPSVTAQNLIIGGAGACAVRVGTLRGITHHRLSGELLSSGGDDELLVSIMMREQKLSIVRPAGAPPLQSVEVFQEDSTASHRQHAHRWHTRRAELATEYGWS